MTWQPIETAPKNKDILLYCPEYKSIYIGQNCEEENYTYFGVSQIGEVYPAYWQPLPEPPTGE